MHRLSDMTMLGGVRGGGEVGWRTRGRGGQCTRKVWFSGDREISPYCSWTVHVYQQVKKSNITGETVARPGVPKGARPLPL